jgi:hypothetical protein
MKLLRKFVGVALLAASTASMADPIGVDAGWYGFCFGGAGSGATNGCQNSGVGSAGNPFTFSLSGPGLLKVTDAFNIGDTFDVFVNSVLAFTTSAPGAGSFTGDPDVAFASGYYSAGSLLLAAGNYSIDIFANQSPFGGGGSYVEIESAIPLPGTLALVGLGLAGLGLRRRAA